MKSCSRCGIVNYCSRTCAGEDWKAHKANCVEEKYRNRREYRQIKATKKNQLDALSPVTSPPTSSNTSTATSPATSPPTSPGNSRPNSRPNSCPNSRPNSPPTSPPTLNRLLQTQSDSPDSLLLRWARGPVSTTPTLTTLEEAATEVEEQAAASGEAVESVVAPAHAAVVEPVAAPAPEEEVPSSECEAAPAHEDETIVEAAPAPEVVVFATSMLIEPAAPTIEDAATAKIAQPLIETAAPEATVKTPESASPALPAAIIQEESVTTSTIGLKHDMRGFTFSAPTTMAMGALVAVATVAWCLLV